MREQEEEGEGRREGGREGCCLFYRRTRGRRHCPRFIKSRDMTNRCREGGGKEGRREEGSDGEEKNE